MMRHKNCVPHYTVLWSQGVVWGGSAGVPPPYDGSCASLP
jgi:hypothetical protein